MDLASFLQNQLEEEGLSFVEIGVALGTYPSEAGSRGNILKDQGGGGAVPLLVGYECGGKKRPRGSLFWLATNLRRPWRDSNVQPSD